jgi:hypothetical protein
MAVRIIMTPAMLDEGAKHMQRIVSANSAIWDRTPEPGKQNNRDKVVRLFQTMGIDIIVENDLTMTPTANGGIIGQKVDEEPSAEQQRIIDKIVGGKLTP